MEIKVTGMAFTRDKWIEKAVHFLEGAVGEFAKQRYAQLTDTPDYWSDEVTRLMKKIKELFNPDKVKTKQVFDRYKAFADALKDASICQDQVVKARNEFASYFVKADDRIHFLKKVSKDAALDSEIILQEMIVEYMDPSILSKISKFF
jgi:hypothetical protein